MNLSPAELESIMERKNEMRRTAYDRRAAQEDKDEVSARACERFIALPEYQSAKVVMWYIDCRSETRTKPHLQASLEKGDKTVVVPYCTVDEQGENKLGLWRLESMDDLVVGKWKILEPPRELWGAPDREMTPESLDIVMVPGVGFDRNGGRMGNGQGYYDRLLERVRPDCALVAMCYETQLFDEILVAPHDVYMDKVVTEDAVYEGKGRSA